MRIYRLAILCALIAGFAACAKPPPQRMQFALGTVCAVNLYEYGTNELYARIFSRIQEIDRSMSAVLEDSAIMAINRNAGRAPAAVPPDLIEVLERARYYAELSRGAFDPTVGPLVRLWGIGTENERIPDEAEIADALALVNWQDLIINKEQGTVFLRRQGMALDLGAIAKGYAADEAARLAREGGVRRGILDLGGNILVLGGRSSVRNSGRRGNRQAEDWRIGVQDPLNERGAYIGVLPVQNKSVVTSGVYERYFEANGRRYHHILSTADGFPVDNGLLSVTIAADRSIDADGLSTAVFALGYEKGRTLIESLPGVEAVFVFEDRTIRITSGLKEKFTLTNDDYAPAIYPY
jgi:thiamine biosynthesis lipoprotein